MTLKTYVRSVGQSIIEGPDYTWISLGDREIRPEQPWFWNSYKQLAPEVNKNVILLGRKDNELFLLLAKIDSQYVDDGNRRISNSIAWIGNDSDEELLRAIAVCNLDLNLRNSFVEQLNQAISMDRSAELGFVVDLEAIKVLENWSVDNARLTNQPIPADRQPRNEKELSPENLGRLADELREISLTSLGKSDRLLLYVSKRVSDLEIENYKIWRSLWDEKININKAQLQKWDDPLRDLYSDSPQRSKRPPHKRPRHNRNFSNSPVFLGIVIVIGVVIIVIAAKFFFKN
jgi:hypothetical protein